MKKELPEVERGTERGERGIMMRAILSLDSIALTLNTALSYSKTGLPMVLQYLCSLLN